MTTDYQNDNNPQDREQREELTLQERYDLLESDYAGLRRRFKTAFGERESYKKDSDAMYRGIKEVQWLINDMEKTVGHTCGICTIIKNKLEKFNL